jgi:hypothetical protein
MTLTIRMPNHQWESVARNQIIPALRQYGGESSVDPVFILQTHLYITHLAIS